MLEDLLDHLFVLDKGEDSSFSDILRHAQDRLGAGERINLIYFLNQSGPGAVGF
jgi:hypothetical protein